MAQQEFRYKETLDKVEIMSSIGRQDDTIIPLEQPQIFRVICPYCNKVFSNNFLMNRHIATHTGEKKHKCNECHKSFIQKTDLDRHIATHSELRPYVCEVAECGSAHKTMKNLSSHIFKCHFQHLRKKAVPPSDGSDTEASYKCETCKKTMKRWGMYLRHIKLHGSYRKINGGDVKKVEKPKKGAPITVKVSRTLPNIVQQRISIGATLPTRMRQKIPIHSKPSPSVQMPAEESKRKIAYKFVDENEFLPDENDPYELVQRHMKLVQTCNEPDFLWDDDDFEPKLESEEEPCSVIETSGYRFETDEMQIKQEP